MKVEIVELSIDLVDPLDPPMRRLDWEVIQDLEQSIRSYGLLQPILVRPNNGRYEIVFGNHRYYAAHRIEEVTTIPVIIKDIPNSEALVLALTENIQRAPLNPYDEGSLYKRILDKSLIDIKELSTKYVHKSIPYIIGRIRIFENLHDELVEKVGLEITITNALYLSKLGKKQQLEVYGKIEDVKKEMSKLVGSRPKGGAFSGGSGIKHCTCPKCGSIHLRGNKNE